MDGARSSRFPNHSWLSFRVVGNARQTPFVFDMQSRAHVISLTAGGQHAVRWITGGRETRWAETVGTVNYTPRDDEHHTFVTAMSPDFASAVLLIPDGHLRGCLASEGHEPRVDFQRILAESDPVLRACMTRLTANADRGASAPDTRLDEAARRLILRLLELSGGGRPDWHDDASVFDRHALSHLIDFIDAHLRIAPTLDELAVLVGLSPSHFAKKFRQSTGLSPHRFINRRRTRRALEVLETGEQSLAGIALDLGFSSQSHFTRLFSLLIGMTPAKYRKRFARTVG